MSHPGGLKPKLKPNRNRQLKSFERPFMKITKSALTALAGLLLATSAPAQVEINISGAVAFRSTAYRAIRGLFNNPTNGVLLSQNPADGPTTPSELKVTWTGRITNLFGGQTVTVRAFYNGAVAGIQDLVQDRNVAFLATSTPGDTTLTSGVKSDVAFSSIFQQATEFPSPVLNDALFGATPINFVKSTIGTAGITNLTTHQLRTILANGSVPAWFLTGNTNDTHTIYFINRDPTAGQRVTVLLESLFTGFPSSYLWNTAANAWQVDPTGRTAGEITTHLNNYSNAISYLISEDSYNVNSGLNVLNYNGSKAFKGTFLNNAPNDFTPVLEGQYSLWVYEHLLIRAGIIGNIPAYRAALISSIESELLTAPFSIPIGRLNVERDADGAPVAPK